MNEIAKQPLIAVVGCGYVGLTTAACLAEFGHEVVGVENSEERLQVLKEGRAPFFEKDLDALVKKGVSTGLLSFAETIADPAKVRVVFVCVPTPSAEDGSADLNIVRAVVENLSTKLSPGAVIVLKSTVPVGTNADVKKWLGRDDLHLVSNPEFLQAGRAVETFQNPDRVVIGAESEEAGDQVAALYEGMEVTVVRTDPQSAELIKYASNTYLALRLSFVNTLATLCEKGGGDASAVLKGMGLDARIGPAFLSPGPGWGGSCFPKDTRALSAVARGIGADTTLLEGSLLANQLRFDQVAAQVKEAVGGGLSGKHIGVLGLTFKAETDDLRESPALAVIERLLVSGARVTAYDPLVAESPLKDLEVVPSAAGAAQGVDAVVVLTEWPEFATLDLVALAETMSGHQVIDTRGLLNKESCQAAGLVLWQVGKG